MHGCHLWTGFCLHSYLVGKIIWLSQAQLGKCKLSLRHRTQILSQINSKLDFPREHARENEQCSPAREWLPSGTRAVLSPPFHAHFHPCLSNMPLFLSSTAEAILRINTQTEPASQACWDGIRDTGTWKASQSLKKSKVHLHDEPKPTAGVYSKPPSPQNL